MDMDARCQLFDFKTTYSFQTIPGVADYNMPLYQAQSGSQVQTEAIARFPLYQGFLGPCYVNGVQVPFYTERSLFYNIWPNYVQPLSPVATGDGTTTTFQIPLPFFPAVPGHLDMSGIISSGSTQDPIFASSLVAAPPTSVFSRVFITYTQADGNNFVIADSGQFYNGGGSGDLYGMLMIQGQPGGSNTSLGVYSTTENTVNYNTGIANVTFPNPPPANTPIQAQCYFIEQGMPRALLFHNNTITLLPPGNTQYFVQMDAYLTPAAFLSTTQSIPFAYMAEYIARGAARKILSDTGDMEQFMFYEPLFKEQETLVWKRSQRQFTSTRTPTIFSNSPFQSGYNNIGQGST